MRTYSACVPSISLPRIQPPVVQWEYMPLRQYSHLPQAVMQEISTRSPGWKAVTPTPTWSIDANAFVAEDAPGAQLGTSPFRMCRSVPQIVVLVTLTIASSAP